MKITKKGIWRWPLNTGLVPRLWIDDHAGRELKALLQADEDLLNAAQDTLASPAAEESSQAITAAKRKKRAMAASGMAEIIAQVEKCGESLPSCRLHACLECVFIGCWRDHIQSHAREKQHAFLMDFNNCNVWCCQCKTYIYDDVLDKILFAEQYFLDYIVSRVREPFVVRPLYPLWKPTLAEAEKIKEHSKVVRCTGMRGLRNLGNTCFMNSYERGGLMRRILQALIHNPLLKAHFLSDKHSVASCTSTSGFCMAYDAGLTQFYSLDTTAFAPHACLHAMWISQTHMAGYSQQDAHEFFISFLDEIHKCSSTKPDGIKQDPCRCIIHQVFGGVLQSDVTCTSCNFVSQTLDPILDLSLEIKNVSKKKNHEISLGDCLEDFTQPEKLAAYTCKKCNMARE
ncbi:hypothetical protein HDU91_000181, partial [Kappamyces sp. JEL0680]